MTCCTWRRPSTQEQRTLGSTHDPSSQELILLLAPTLLALLPLVIVTDATEQDGDIQSSQLSDGACAPGGLSAR